MTNDLTANVERLERVRRAAPDLLDAAIMALAIFESEGYYGKTVTTLKTAIAKAEGE